ncbi:MAG: hypothetical protein WC205_07560 [Opitutaceae bacterium]|jgi:hypothetical protein
MKNPRLPLAEFRLGRRSVLVAAVLCGVVSLRALERSQWRQQAPVEVTAPGYVKLDLSPEVLDCAAPNLADIRLLDPQGSEVPYAFVRPAQPVTGRAFAPPCDVKLINGATVVTLTTGTKDPLAYASLETAPGDFLKSADVAVSADGEHWETLATGLPVFRRDGTTRNRVSLLGKSAALVRITLDDRPTSPLAITGAMLAPAPVAGAAPSTVVQAVGIDHRDEYAGETVLTLDLAAAHLTLVSLEFDSVTPVFRRGVTLSERRMENDVLVEHVIARGVLSRRPADAVGVSAVWTTGMVSVPREVILHIDNGDSPPLPLSEVRVRRLKREVVFNAEQAGAWTLLAGNLAATAPRYDLTRFSGELSAVTTEVGVGRLAANPEYQIPPEALADVPLTGAALDPLAWTFRRAVTLGGGGVQQLELDLGVIARARSDFADIRLISDGKQIPYLIEHPHLSREFAAMLTPADDPHRPRFSRWQLKLPQAGLPLNRLVLASSTPLFQRQLRLWEPVTDERGQSSTRVLADASWVRLPGQAVRNLVLPLNGRVAGDTLIIETDNEDNPPIVLTSVQGAVNVTRLLFKPAPETPAPELIYGNPQVSAARYDLVLIAPQILGAPKHVATLGPEAQTAAALDLFSGRGSVLFFWGVLGLVVVLLLVIVARLLPKAVTPEAPK